MACNLMFFHPRVLAVLFSLMYRSTLLLSLLRCSIELLYGKGSLYLGVGFAGDLFGIGDGLGCRRDLRLSNDTHENDDSK